MRYDKILKYNIYKKRAYVRFYCTYVFIFNEKNICKKHIIITRINDASVTDSLSTFLPYIRFVVKIR